MELMENLGTANACRINKTVLKNTKLCMGLVRKASWGYTILEIEGRIS
jgi:hypothetical protein